jgi:hypothetical protein
MTLIANILFQCIINIKLSTRYFTFFLHTSKSSVVYTIPMHFSLAYCILSIVLGKADLTYSQPKVILLTFTSCEN